MNTPFKWSFEAQSNVIRCYTACPQPAPVTSFFSKFVHDGTDSQTSHCESPLATPIPHLTELHERVLPSISGDDLPSTLASPLLRIFSPTGNTMFTRYPNCSQSQITRYILRPITYWGIPIICMQASVIIN